MSLSRILKSAAMAAIFIAGTAKAQDQTGVDSTGLPGDGFSLQGALEMFQKSATLEEFEKLLNTEDNHVNNLDLNDDGDIDYVKVLDKQDGDVHSLVLQVAVSETENQDVAVIELEKTGAQSAVVQIVGDEDLYGEEVIVEPGDKGENTFNSYSNVADVAKSGPSADENIEGPVPIIINVWLWPSVRYVYAPGYIVWRSPWRWHNYPGWWHPWRPIRWTVWHPYHRFYQTRYVVVRTNRIIRAREIYRPARVTSVTVRTRHQASVNNYRVTRTRTSVTGPRGHSVMRKTTTVQGRGGRKAFRTKTRRKR